MHNPLDSRLAPTVKISCKLNNLDKIDMAMENVSEWERDHNCVNLLDLLVLVTFPVSIPLALAIRFNR